MMRPCCSASRSAVLLIAFSAVASVISFQTSSITYNGSRSQRFRSSSTLRSSAANVKELTIYGHPGTRSPLVNWACLELDVPFRMGKLSDNPHPFQQLPCLADVDGVVAFESGAILQYLLDTYGSETLPSADRAMISSWIFWANASFDPICFKETPQGKVYDTGLREPNHRVDELDAMLQKQKWLVRDTFSLADVAVASYGLYVLLFFPQVSIAEHWPHLAHYLQRAAERPAYATAFGADMQHQLVGLLQRDVRKQ